MSNLETGTIDTQLPEKQGISIWKTTLPSFALVFADLIGLSLTWKLAYLTRASLGGFLGPLNTIDPYLKIQTIIVLMGIANGAFFGLYRTRRRLSSLTSWGRLITAGYHYTLYLIVVAYFLREFELGRSVIFLAGLYALIYLIISRQCFRWLKSRAYRNGKGLVRTAIVGTGNLATEVRENLRHHPEIGFQLVGFITHPEDSQTGSVSPDQYLGDASNITDIVQKHQIEELFVAIPHLKSTDQLNMLNFGQTSGLRIQLVSDMFGVIASRAKVDEVSAFPVITLRDGHMPRPYAFLKRTIDLAISAFGCLVWFLFFHWWISLWIKMDSKGPIFFSQERVGRDGRKFKIYKYRTMGTETKQYAVAPIDQDDPRITTAGKWLRKTSLDELPQLWNVLKGDMSMVGPRPEMPFIVDEYEDWQKRRLDVKPGVTGLWQVIGRKNLPLHLNMQYDFYYISNQSLLLDLEILIKTIPAVLFGKGAF